MSALRATFDLKVRAVLGPDPADARDVRILNRIARWSAGDGRAKLEYEADPRHAEIAVAALGLEAAKGVSTPMVKPRTEDYVGVARSLTKEEVKLYRSVTVRIQYLAQDRPDLQFASKERARHMKDPNERDLVALKRIGRYLVTRPRLLMVFEQQAMPEKMVVYVDTDHAGCLVTRKSTTGLALVFGKHCVRSSSNTQSDIALSSGESEFYGAVKAASVGLGAVAMAADLGIKVELELRMDSTAGKAISERQGLGRTRHIATRFLWVQQRVARGDLRITKWPGKDNPADLMTKALPEASVVRSLLALRCMFAQGRSSHALQVQAGAAA